MCHSLHCVLWSPFVIVLTHFIKYSSSWICVFLNRVCLLHDTTGNITWHSQTFRIHIKVMAKKRNSIGQRKVRTHCKQCYKYASHGKECNANHQDSVNNQPLLYLVSKERFLWMLNAFERLENSFIIKKGTKKPRWPTILTQKSYKIPNKLVCNF